MANQQEPRTFDPQATLRALNQCIAPADNGLVAEDDAETVHLPPFLTRWLQQGVADGSIAPGTRFEQIGPE